MSATPGPWRRGVGDVFGMDVDGPDGRCVATVWRGDDLPAIIQAPMLLAGCALARDVRAAQRRYVAERTTERLIESKRLEKALDAALAAVLAMATTWPDESGVWPGPLPTLLTEGSAGE